MRSLLRNQPDRDALISDRVRSVPSPTVFENQSVTEIKHLFPCIGRAVGFSGVDVLSAFREVLASEPSMAVAMAAIKVLMKVLEKCSAGTLQAS